MKHEAFLHIAGLLNANLQIIPLLFGSLGLKKRLHMDLHADDIDILLPGSFLTVGWDKLVSLMAADGYTLFDAEEHAFKKAGLCVAFADIEGLTPFADCIFAESASAIRKTEITKINICFFNCNPRLLTTVLFAPFVTGRGIIYLRTIHFLLTITNICSIVVSRRRRDHSLDLHLDNRVFGNHADCGGRSFGTSVPRNRRFSIHKKRRQSI